MFTVKDLLQRKGRELWTVSQNTTVIEAIKLMSGTKIGALMVLDDTGMVGIISERDMMDVISQSGADAFEKPIKNYMTTSIVTVSVDSNIEDCMKLMTDKHIRHLPVLREGKLVGVLSIRDLVKVVITEKDSLISDLQNYIVGSR